MSTNLHTMSNVVLAVNPSHLTPDEHRFWERVSVCTKERGWQLVQIAIRQLPHTKDAISIQVPIRLAEFNQLPIPVGEQSWDWVDIEYLRVLDEWEHLRWDMDERSSASFNGLMRLVQLVNTTLLSVRPRVVVTHNKIDPIAALFRLAAIRYEIATAVVERSPLDSIWLEPDGLFGESRISRDYEECRYDLQSDFIEIGKIVIARLADSPYGFRQLNRPVETKKLSIAKDRGPIFFLPMDHVVGTAWAQRDHPQRVTDNPLYESPGQAIHDLAEKVRALSGSLVVRKHPSCRYLSEYILPKQINLCDNDLGTLLRLSDVVIVFNSKVAYPAIASGKPVVTLSPNPVACSGATYHCLNNNDVHKTLKLALDRDHLHERLEEFVPFVGWLASRVFYSCEKSPPYPAKRDEDFVDDLMYMATATQPVRQMPEKELAQAIAVIHEMVGCKKTGEGGPIIFTKWFWSILQRLGVEP